MILGLLRSPFRRRAFTRRTHPLSSLWKMTRSIMPETCSVAGLRSGIAAFICGDSFSHGRSALGDPFGKAILRRFGCRGWGEVGWGVSEVRAAFVTSLAAYPWQYLRAAVTRH
jgi:hypothetical protein